MLRILTPDGANLYVAPTKKSHGMRQGITASGSLASARPTRKPELSKRNSGAFQTSLTPCPGCAQIHVQNPDGPLARYTVPLLHP
jgi:hypothetical protein